MAHSLSTSLRFCGEAILGPQFISELRNRTSARSHAALFPADCIPSSAKVNSGRRLKKSFAGEYLPLRQSYNESWADHACAPSRRSYAHRGVVDTRARVADTAAAAPASSTKEKARSPLLDADVPDYVKEAVKSQPWKGALEPSTECSYTVDPSKVKGRIPDDLRGTYVRLGPGNPRIGDRKQGHWFDGDGMIYSFSLDGPDTPVKSQSKWVDTPRIRQRLSAQANEVKAKGVWTPADGGLLANVGVPENPSNTAPLFFNGQLLALAEGGPPRDIDAQTLQTRGIDTSYVGDFAFSAHPKVDPDTGVMYNHGVGPEISADVLALQLFKVSPDGKLLKRTRVALDAPTYIHDLVISENYMVTFIPPWYSTQADLIKYALGLNSFGNCFKWVPERGTRAVIARKDTLEVVADVRLPPFSMYHNANAYEEDGKLHVVTCRLNGPRADLETVFADMWARSWTWDNLSSLWDYTFDMDTWQLVSEGPAAKRPDGSITPAHGHDFPAIHPGYVGKKARYVYVVANGYRGRLEGPDISDDHVGASFVPGSQVPDAFGFANSLEKYDLSTGEVKEHYLGKTSSDMVFVPKEGGAKEDDGYLLSVVYNDDRHTSSVLILDAVSMDTVCEIELPVHVTTTFHGCWVPRL